ncbi:hypothetical protein P692DRAFT_20877347 [Suillus brevipes Sb2]|nr:hypothetical protein P692DRAFT_20877347 [Suillus brevipes Sb2]
MLQKTAEHASKHWLKNTPTFHIPNVKIQQLAQRSGLLLLTELLSLVADLKKAQKDVSVKLAFDGLPSDIVEDTLYASQVLHHFLCPHKSKKDGRHDFSDFLMHYGRQEQVGDEDEDEDEDEDQDDAPTTFSHGGLEYEFANQYEDSECTSVSHLVHSWQMQGHHGKKSQLKPSADMVCNAQVALAVAWYMKRTTKFAIALKELFRVAYPDDFKIYEKAFEAGVWEAADPGPWLGRAIVWKLNVLPHRDGLDGGPTAIFCLGSFSGG